MILALSGTLRSNAKSSSLGHCRYDGQSGFSKSVFFDKRDWYLPEVLGWPTLHTGLIGFDVEVGSFIVRPELLRLLKRGNQRHDNERVALAA